MFSNQNLNFLHIKKKVVFKAKIDYSHFHTPGKQCDYYSLKKRFCVPDIVFDAGMVGWYKNDYKNEHKEPMEFTIQEER